MKTNKMKQHLKIISYPILNAKKVEAVLEAVQASLTPDLLKGKYKNREGTLHPTTGHCYAATEACYYLLEGAKHGLVPQVARDGEDTHWWLKAPNGTLIDPTKEQYLSLGEDPPYQSGKGCGLLTNKPSKRASIIMERALEHTILKQYHKKNTFK